MKKHTNINDIIALLNYMVQRDLEDTRRRIGMGFDPTNEYNLHNDRMRDVNNQLQMIRKAVSDRQCVDTFPMIIETIPRQDEDWARNRFTNKKGREVSPATLI